MLTAESAAKTLGVERGPGAYVNVALIAKLHLTTNVAFLLPCICKPQTPVQPSRLRTNNRMRVKSTAGPFSTMILYIHLTHPCKYAHIGGVMRRNVQQPLYSSIFTVSTILAPVACNGTPGPA